jgi:hypothetical protein
MCGFQLKKTNLKGNHNWWLEMQRVVIKTPTDVWNYAMKNIHTKFKGKLKQGNIDFHKPSFQLQKYLFYPEGCDKATRAVMRRLFTSWK